MTSCKTTMTPNLFPFIPQPLHFQVPLQSFCTFLLLSCFVSHFPHYFFPSFPSIPFPSPFPYFLPYPPFHLFPFPLIFPFPPFCFTFSTFLPFSSFPQSFFSFHPSTLFLLYFPSFPTSFYHPKGKISLYLTFHSLNQRFASSHLLPMEPFPDPSGFKAALGWGLGGSGVSPLSTEIQTGRTFSWDPSQPAETAPPADASVPHHKIPASLPPSPGTLQPLRVPSLASRSWCSCWR